MSRSPVGRTNGRRRQGALVHPVTSGFAVAVGAILAIALTAVLYLLSSVLVLLVLALFLGLGLDPVVRRLQGFGLSRAWGVCVVAFLFVVLVAGILIFIVPATVQQIKHLIDAAPETIESFTQTSWFRAVQTTVGGNSDDTANRIWTSIFDLSSFLTVSGGVLKAGLSTLGAISNAVIVIVLTLYFVVSLDSFKQALVSLLPKYKRARFSALTDEVTASVGGVVAGGVTLSTINALVVFAINIVLGSPIAVLMMLVAFFVTLVPLMGSLLFLVIGSMASLVVSPTACLVFAVTYLIYIQIEAYAVTPKIMGRAVAVPGVLVIIGAIAGATLMGLLGALVAIPITASVLIILRKVVIPAQDAKSSPTESPKRRWMVKTYS
ncbi:AI-2E family transporter [Brevibacterium siliguriense]|uniref:AI-2E family transporter n=1 Tax=Brevibacterium siliguriense TaxID=1136497 RepID=UPI000B888214|nr:AI-2E family transporter [Brevibacterium siliguriense]